MTRISIPEVVCQLSSLSPERIAEVYDFVLFLKTRQGNVVDESDEWSEDDVRDATHVSVAYAEAALLGEEPTDDSTG